MEGIGVVYCGEDVGELGRGVVLSIWIVDIGKMGYILFFGMLRYRMSFDGLKI